MLISSDVVAAPSTEPPSLPPPVKGKCPNGEWDEFDDQCLAFFKDEPKRHHNSTAYCQSLHTSAKLLSIHSEAENWVVRESFRDGAVPWGWIGLYRRHGGILLKYGI